MARKERKSRPTALEREDQAFEEGKARLDELVRQLVDRESDIKEQLYQLVENYKAICRQTVERRAQIIQDVSKKNAKAGRYLESETDFKVPVPERMAWAHKGVLITYQPDVVALAPNILEESKVLSSTAAESRKIQDVPIPPKVEPAIPSIRRPPQAPIDVPRNRSGRCRVLQLPITMQTTTTGNYWVFDYQFREGTYLFVLRCPAKACQSPIFSHHPLKQERAIKHLKACGVHFKNEGDIVRRYARQVIPGRRGREVTHRWARRHNSHLLASNEKHLEEENL